jgi:hypothetical protein
MPAGDSWTITSETGGADGAKLTNCLISQTATQTQLAASDGTILGTVNSVTPNITFDTFSVPGSDIKFQLTITSFTYGVNNDEAHGSWITVESLEEDPESGEWTGQAGSGEPESESAAAADAS